MSPTIENFDRVVKYNQSLEIERLRDDVLVSQMSVHVEHHAKNEAGEWHTRILTRPEEILTLAGAPASLTLADLYDRLEMPQ